MSISFQGMGEQLVSFEAGTVTAGYPVSMSDNGKVANSGNGDCFAGIAVHKSDDGFAAVQLSGFVTLAYSGTAPSLGWQRIAANGSGGVKTASSSVSEGVVTEGGRLCLVVDVDTANTRVGLFL
ncbi:MAG: hypothetical protein IKD96_04085 [Oscillospiraceae bacterium]|nr:hypothetical protein [Oscillospiraceae bacterium]